MFSQLYSIYIKNMLNFANFGEKVWIAVFSVSNLCFQYAYILRFWYIAHPYNGNNGNF